MRHILSLVGIVMLLMARLQPTFAQDPTSDPLAMPYAERGPHTVGTQATTVTNGERELSVTIWYPAAPVAEDAATVTYQVSALQVAGTAYPDAAPHADGSTYPVVVFSHGAALSWIMYTTLLEHIASYGYVVVAMDHPTNTLMDAAFNRPDFEANTPLNFAWRVQDLAAVLNFVETDLNGVVAGIADSGRIALIGHSFGGYTALVGAGGSLDFGTLASWCAENAGGPLDPDPTLPFVPYADNPSDASAGSCFLSDYDDQIAAELGVDVATTPSIAPLPYDPRIQAVIVYAPWQAPLFGEAGLAALETPLLVFGGTADRVTPYERDASQIYAWAGSTDKTLITFEAGGHAIYTDECPALVLAGNGAPLCDDPVWDGNVSRAIIGAYTVAFLEDILKETDGAWTITSLDGITIASTRP